MACHRRQQNLFTVFPPIRHVPRRVFMIGWGDRTDRWIVWSVPGVDVQESSAVCSFSRVFVFFFNLAAMLLTGLADDDLEAIYCFL